VTSCPTLPAADFYVGLAHARLGANEKARAKLSTAVALAPDHLPARFALARVLVELGQVDEAGSVLELATRMAPSSLPAAVRWAEYLRFVKKDLRRAVAAFERAVELAPRRWQLRHQLGLVLFELEQLDQALAVMREVCEWTEESAPRELLARIEAALEDADQPTERFAPAPRDSESHPRITATLDLIQLFVASGQWARVVEVVTRALRADPKSASLLLARGRAYEKLGQLSEAVQDLSLAVALAPRDADAQEALMRVQAARKRG
jgi:tetratricopeptide (TPR) repeat protein